MAKLYNHTNINLSAMNTLIHMYVLILCNLRHGSGGHSVGIARSRNKATELVS
jgi:hypothetical protein